MNKEIIQAIYSIYLADLDFREKLAGGLYFYRAPLNVGYPYAVYFFISSIEEDTFTDVSENSLIQFNIFSNESSAEKLLALTEYFEQKYNWVNPGMESYTNVYFKPELKELFFADDVWQIFDSVSALKRKELKSMAKISGKSGKVEAPGVIAGIKSWTCDYTGDALESTDFGSNGKKEYVGGLTGWSGSFEGNYSGETPIALLTEVALKLYVDGTKYVTGQALITGFHITTPVDGLVTISYDFQGTGALTLKLDVIKMTALSGKIGAIYISTGDGTLVEDEEVNLNGSGYTSFENIKVDTIKVGTNWRASIAYGLLGYFVKPTTSNGHKYKCIQTGMSGSVEPTWPTIPGGEVTDGTVKWKEDGTEVISPSDYTWTVQGHITCVKQSNGKIKVTYRYYAITQAIGFHNWTIDSVGDVYDATDFDSEGEKEYVVGLEGFTGSAESYWIFGDVNLLDRLNEEVIVKFYMDTGTSDYWYEGWAIINGIHPNTPVDTLIGESIDFQGNYILSYRT